MSLLAIVENAVLMSKRLIPEKLLGSLVPYQKSSLSSTTAHIHFKGTAILVHGGKLVYNEVFSKGDYCSFRAGVSSCRRYSRRGYLCSCSSNFRQLLSGRAKGIERSGWQVYRRVGVQCQAQKTVGQARGEKDRELKETVYDAILVLAGGQVPGGGVPVWVEKRLDKALELQRLGDGRLCKIVCLGGGTPHKAPMLSPQGFVLHESSSCADYLHSKGAPFSQLIKEWGSYDTIGNGYFSLTQHAIPRRWRTLAVVTSDFHMPRTKAVFKWIFGLHGAGVALQQHSAHSDSADVGALRGPEAQGFQLVFHGVSDEAVDDTILQARLKRERRSLQNLSKMMEQIHSLEDFHEWFHTDHKAYNTRNQHDFGEEEEADEALLSY